MVKLKPNRIPFFSNTPANVVKYLVFDLERARWAAVRPPGTFTRPDCRLGLSDRPRPAPAPFTRIPRSARTAALDPTYLSFY